jgi:2-keto-3-deoxy-L-rhamnonate aldolase RhmA
MEIMAQSRRFKQLLASGEVLLGTAVSFADPTVSEALAGSLDFIWVDTEHNPYSLETVQAHIMAVAGTNCPMLVRVPWNDPVLIKPILDIGAAGVIVPFIRTVEDAKLAVAACRYPPEGIRGFGPRRPSNYARLGGPDFCKAANEAVVTVVQIEHIDAVNNLDGILAVPGLTSILIGSNDLSGSMGLMGQPRHPDVLAAIDAVLAKARKAGMPVGIAIGNDPDMLIGWINKGVQWLTMGNDYSLMLHAVNQVAGRIREHVAARANS